MSATGVRWFTMAFVLSGGGCTPGVGQHRVRSPAAPTPAAIAQIRAAGGDIVPSFGGWRATSSARTAPRRRPSPAPTSRSSTPTGCSAIDIDIENSDEFENEVVQDRILNALKIVKQNNPGIQTIITFGTTTTGPNFWGTRLINRAAALQANIDVFTIMPFDFGGGEHVTRHGQRRRRPEERAEVARSAGPTPRPTRTWASPA